MDRSENAKLKSDRQVEEKRQSRIRTRRRQVRLLKTSVVYLTRCVGRVPFFSGPLYSAISGSSLAPARRERLLSYLFSNAQLRQFAKRQSRRDMVARKNALQKAARKRKHEQERQQQEGNWFARFKESTENFKLSGTNSGQKFHLKRSEKNIYGACWYAALWTLLVLETSGFAFVNVVLFGLLRRIPWLVPRVQRVRDTMALAIEQSSGPLHGAHIVHLAHIHETKRSHNTEIEGLSQFSTIHVVMEPGAHLPDFLGEPELQNSFFKIYSFADVRGQAAMLNISDRWAPSTLRDRFNDISPEGEELFQTSNTASAALTEKMFTDIMRLDGSQSAGLKEAVSTALSDTISHQLSLAHCLRNALSAVPRGDGVVYITARREMLRGGWPVLSRELDPERTFIVDGGCSDWRELLFEIRFRIKSEATAAQGLLSDSGVNEQGIQELADVVRDVANGVREIAGRFSKQLNMRFGGASVIVVAHNGRPLAYRQTVGDIHEEVCKRAIESNASVLFLHCAGRIDQDLVGGDYASNMGQRVLAADLSRFLSTVNGIRLGFSAQDNLKRLFRHYLFDRVTLDGLDHSELVVGELADSFFSKLAWCLSGFFLAEALKRELEIEGVVASTTRQWLVRSVAAGFLEKDSLTADMDEGVRLIDVQSMNVLAHPKYRRPYATDIAVIDRISKRVHTSYFGFDEKRTHVVGSAQIDHIRRGHADVDSVRSRAKFDLLDGEKIITLISQLQPIETMLSIAMPLAKYVKESDGVKLLLRLHPREGEDRAEAYRVAFNDVLSTSDYVISRDEPVGCVISVSSCCVTIYSNMAREAALLGIPVLVPGWEGITTPFRLDEEGVATAVPTPGDFGVMLDKVITDPERTKNMPPYFSKNPELTYGVAAERILNLVWIKKSEEAGKSQMLAIEKDETLKFDGRDVTIIMAPGVKSWELPPVFECATQVRVFGRQAKEASLSLPANTIVDSGNYTLSNAKQFDVMVSDANAKAMLCVDAMLSCESFSTATRRQLNEYREAFWLLVRPGIISACQAEFVCQQGIQQSNSSKLVFAVANKEQGRRLAKLAIDDGCNVAEILVIMLPKTGDFEWLDVTELLEEVPSKNKGSGASRDNFYKGKFDFPVTTERRGSGEAASLLFVTTDWSLKTVPATLGPVIADSLNRGERVIMALNRRSLGDIRSELVEFGAEADKLANLETMLASDLSKSSRVLPQKLLRQAASEGKAYLSRADQFFEYPPHIQRNLQKSVDQLCRTHLPTVMSFAAYSTQQMEAARSVSLGCPGRQWHCAVAHTVSGEVDGYSMTLQNAYMTAGYTYTAPFGDCITAIDEWSAQLMVDHYGCSPNALEVFSTPRFDSLVSSAVPEQSEARMALGLQSDQKVILFAAQVGLDDECERIVRGLGEAVEALGDGFRLVVKLHPRSPESLRARFTVASGTSAVDVVTDGDIKTYLAATDLVVTMYSNVATEAAILAKPLLLVKPETGDLPLPIDEFGFGHTVQCNDEIIGAVSSFFSDATFIKAREEEQAAWREGNPIMVEGSSRRLLAKRLREKLSVREPV